MTDPIRHLPLDDKEDLLTREWLVTNGLGGYASGTVSGDLTRRYHGILVAALPAPYGRMVMLNRLAESLELPDGQTWDLGDVMHLVAFQQELGLPVWRYQAGDVVLEKRILMPHQQNTTMVCYRLLSGPGTSRLRLQPYIQFRGYEESVDAAVTAYKVTAHGARYDIHGPDEELTPLKLHFSGERTRLRLDAGSRCETIYALEGERGYASRGLLWTPGDFAADLSEGGEAILLASTESWHTCLAMTAAEAREFELERRRRLISIAHPALRTGPAAELVLAADQFVIRPASRIADAARAQSSGDDVRTIIAGYHWFTDWGRDTMISLEGLTMTCGRVLEAGWILRTFGHYVRNGLIPNMFPDGQDEGLYHTADATLWFFHAVDRYLAYGGNRQIMRVLLPKLTEIIDRHIAGTRFGIVLDTADGLLRQGAEDYQLTWMDAKVDGWVVTPRRGKAVEINALWYNALCNMERWLRAAGDEQRAEELDRCARQCRESFNQRFWCDGAGHLYDVVDGEFGDDVSLRPNQILAISLPNAVLDQKYWKPVVDKVSEHLLTPVGLRSLAPSHPDYKPVYFGDLRARDAAYHQGTVWGWLIGPFIDAWLKLHPEDRAGARKFLEGFVPHLDRFGIGTIAEIFDATEPFHPRGCISQAWSVAEWLRCWAKTKEGGELFDRRGRER